eukprot:518009_1
MHRLYQLHYNFNDCNTMGDILGEHEGHQFNTDLFDASFTLLSARYDVTALDILYIGLKRDTESGELHKNMLLKGNPVLTGNVRQSDENTKYWFCHRAVNKGQAFVIAPGFAYGIPITADSCSKGQKYGINEGESAWQIFIGAYFRHDIQDTNKGLLYHLDLYGFNNDGNIKQSNPYHGQTLAAKKRVLNDANLDSEKLKSLFGRHNAEYGHHLHNLNVNNKKAAIKTARNSPAMIQYQKMRQRNQKKKKLIIPKREYNFRPRKRTKTK